MALLSNLWNGLQSGLQSAGQWIANLLTGNTSGNGTGAETAGVHIPTTSTTQVSNNVTGQPSSNNPSPTQLTPISAPTTGFSDNGYTLASGSGSDLLNSFQNMTVNLPGLPDLNLGAGLDKIGNFLLPYMDAISGKAGVDESRREYNQSMEFAKEEQTYQRGIDAQNQANIDREFQYQKYLNENQTQIASRDAQLAGINPLAMKGNSVSSTGGTISSGSSAPILDSGLAQAFGVQGSQLLALGNAMMSSAQTYKQRKSAENIARMGDETTKLMASFTDALSLATLIKDCISSGVNPDFIKDISSNIGGYSTTFSHQGVGKFNEDMLKNKYLNELYDNNLKYSELEKNDSVKKLLETLGLGDDSSGMLSGLVKLLLLKK